MAKIIKLNAGKALGAFPGFVETFNWLVDFCLNLKGNGEEYNDSGSDEDRNGIVVDRSVPDHPVIRGGGGSGVEEANMEFESGSDSNIKFSKTETVEDEAKKTVITMDVYYV